MKGNEVIAEAAIQAGCRFYAGYPITPQNEIPEYMSRRLPEVGGVFIQAESELAAINMVFGAAAAGVRAMTSSSSPGISLKQEGISYLAGAELPAVIVNVQRGGPGLGNISASQQDYFQAVKGGGHGDYRLLVYAPYSHQELWELTMKAFDKADVYRNPVMILADGVLGQMMEPFVPVKYEPQDNLPPKDWVLDGCEGREPRVIKSLFMGEGELEQRNYKLKEKYEKMRSTEVLYEEVDTEDAELLLVAFGVAARVCLSAQRQLRKEGIPVGLFRPITLFPFPEKKLREISTAKRVLVVEMNLGQMVEDVKLSVDNPKEVEFYGRPGGAIITPEEIVWRVQNSLQKT